MDNSRRQPSASDLLRDKQRAGNKPLSLLLMSALTVIIAAWVMFLGWAAWRFLGES